MQKLQTMLQDSPPEVLYAIAQIWGIEADKSTQAELIKHIAAVMLQPQNAVKIWEKLNPQERGAIQTLVASKQHQMTQMQFEMLHGKIRKMGRATLDRDKPHLHPLSPAEGLYYRGIVGEGFEQAATGLRPIIYIPADLMALLPLHQTSYSNLKADIAAELPPEAPEAPQNLTPLGGEEVENMQLADTSIVDDMTTLLAYLRIHSAAVVDDVFSPAEVERILPYFLVQDERRLAFLLGVGVSAELIQMQEGRAYPGKTKLQTWLSAARGTQLKDLAAAWRGSRIYQDLWHVPSLYPEPSGWSYDPVVGRETLLRFLKEYAPLTEWWSLDDLIELIKNADPAFQRPGGDYDSWYIRGADGDYLRGYASWDAVEGALLEFYCQGPLHWLGLADLAEESVRLSAYGRAFLGAAAWQNPNIKPDNILIQPDGILQASRRVPCVDRFQLARFTLWHKQTDPYTYKLNAAGLQQAAEQGITPAHVGAFLKRHLDGKPLPPKIAALLETWQGSAAAEVTFEQVWVVRTTSKEVLDRMYENPSLRRYLRSRLGDTAGVIDAEQWEALQQALTEVGIKVEIIPNKN